MMKLCDIIDRRKPALWLAATVLALVPGAVAHAGFQHVMGTVAKVSGNVLTVKTAKGNVDVKLSDKTEITREQRKAKIADLKPGARIVAEVPAESTDKIAKSVRIGAAAPVVAAGHSHSAQK